QMLDEDLRDASILVEPSYTPGPTPSNTTPPILSSITITLNNSPSPSPSLREEYIESEEPRRSERKGKGRTQEEANFIASEEDLAKLDMAYTESVRLYLSAATEHGEPKSYREAIHPDNPEAEKWKEAIKVELDALEERGTWKVVPRPE